MGDRKICHCGWRLSENTWLYYLLDLSGSSWVSAEVPGDLPWIQLDFIHPIEFNVVYLMQRWSGYDSIHSVNLTFEDGSVQNVRHNRPQLSPRLVKITSHWAHAVVATLNRHQWRWFSVATTSCAQWVNSVEWQILYQNRPTWKIKLVSWSLYYS